MAAPDILNRPWMCCRLLSMPASVAASTWAAAGALCLVMHHLARRLPMLNAIQQGPKIERSTLRITSIGSTYPPEDLRRERRAGASRQKHTEAAQSSSPSWRGRGPPPFSTPSADYEAGVNCRCPTSAQHPAHSTQHRASHYRYWPWPPPRFPWRGHGGGVERGSSVPGLYGDHRCREPCLASSHSSAFAGARSPMDCGDCAELWDQLTRAHRRILQPELRAWCISPLCTLEPWSWGASVVRRQCMQYWMLR